MIRGGDEVFGRLSTTVIFLGVFLFGFKIGSLFEENKAQEMIISNREAIIKDYEQKLQDYQIRKDEMEKELAQRDIKLNALRDSANRLREQIRTQNSTIKDTTIKGEQRECLSRDDTSGRARKMEAVLDRATTLVHERDKIAQMYNSLRKLCDLK